MENIITKASEFLPLLAFLAPLGGEMAVILLAFWSAQGEIYLWTIIVFSCLGMLAVDSFWFWVTRSPWASRIRSHMKIYNSYSRLETKIESFSHRNDIFILLISKILIGTRILIMVYISLRNISYIRFLAYNSIATFIWAIMLGYFGWFAGLGYYNLKDTYDTITTTILIMAITVCAFYAVVYLVKSLVIKNDRK